MTFKLLNINVIGDPTTDDSVYLPVRITYSDNPDIEAATQYLEFQIESPAAYGRRLAEVERDALTVIRKFIGDRLIELNNLKEQG
ncbi:MAG: hypothetical protein ABS35_15420 [Kaistia sp. SCN 65-12]|nr:MAG: hypothetical protein ABS35_15420 [Kaistia sp. SCN 65-12]